MDQSLKRSCKCLQWKSSRHQLDRLLARNTFPATCFGKAGCSLARLRLDLWCLIFETCSHLQHLDLSSSIFETSSHLQRLVQHDRDVALARASAEIRAKLLRYTCGKLLRSHSAVDVAFTDPYFAGTTPHLHLRSYTYHYHPNLPPCDGHLRWTSTTNAFRPPSIRHLHWPHLCCFLHW